MVKTYSVSQVNGYIRNLLDDDVFLAGFFIEGELSNVKVHSSGHMYFSLKDAKASISAVMFESSARGIEFVPENGTKVVAYGRVSSYEKTGAIQFYAEMMHPLGLGGLFLAFRKLKDKLAAEGLFDEGRKKPLPPFPKTIGIVTSRDGAALRDIMDVARRRNPRVSLILAPAAVQGDGASAEIAAAIGLLNEHGACDIIIVGRGGGSMEDLWAFNEETVARAVAASEIPVVSAVGHETDFSICDFAADLRAATPSAAAEICVPSLSEIRERAARLLVRLNNAAEYAADSYWERFTSLSKDISQAACDRVRSAEDRARIAMRALENLSPLNTLRRGFAIAFTGDSAVRSAGEVKAGMEMSVKLIDGTIYANVLRTRLEMENV